MRGRLAKLGLPLRLEAMPASLLLRPAAWLAIAAAGRPGPPAAAAGSCACVVLGWLRASGCACGISMWPAPLLRAAGLLQLTRLGAAVRRGSSLEILRGLRCRCAAGCAAGCSLCVGSDGSLCGGCCSSVGRLAGGGTGCEAGSASCPGDAMDAAFSGVTRCELVAVKVLTDFVLPWHAGAVGLTLGTCDCRAGAAACGCCGAGEGGAAAASSAAAAVTGGGESGLACRCVCCIDAASAAEVGGLGSASMSSTPLALPPSSPVNAGSTCGASSRTLKSHLLRTFSTGSQDIGHEDETFLLDTELTAVSSGPGETVVKFTVAGEMGAVAPAASAAAVLSGVVVMAGEVIRTWSLPPAVQKETCLTEARCHLR